MNNFESKLRENETDAEIAIDDLVGEVFYNGRIYTKKNEVLQVLDSLTKLRHYIEDKEWTLELELNCLEQEEE